MIIRRTKRRNCGYGKREAMAEGPLSPYALVYEAVVPKDYGLAKEHGKRVGCIRVDDTGEGVTPFFSWVEKPYRRRGLGTKLYEAAARGSCHVFKQPLKSSLKLSRQSRGFWEKQLRKGRADCEMRYGPYCTAFSLRCPPPESLSGAPLPSVLIYDSLDDPRGGLVRARTKAGVVIGELETNAVSHDRVMMVSHLKVNKKYRRRGLATRLYEQAAKESCAKWERPLASGLARSRNANWFWRKQESKGRAERRWFEGEDYYVLRCPSPASLAAAAEIEPAIQAEERELVRWATERGALFDNDGRVLQRWRGTKTRIRIPDEDKAQFPGKIFSHSHPPTAFLYRKNDKLATFKSGASLSPQDGYMAAALDLAEMRVVTKVPVDGQTRTVVYRIQRPAGGWPPPWKIKDQVDAASSSHRRVLQNKLRRGEVEYEKVATVAADEGWKTAAPKLGIKYDSVMLDGVLERRRPIWPWAGALALLVAIPFAL